ncbi:non-ribosomal peptide synthetase [Nostoc sp. UHCC 0252]|uniref:non-ribosomal peptide synthetase n=1 Tax=Nostoc sp. UHCC 0252 TaxID=3110241 RepID=UPI002B200760|nr:non-ribosomal peptide synthetase [Nostoc sp. UHCC 0252]MEA5603241.1 amino acid adenylation domain-containing protein [Nostoc sp. UHCC 0252]
MSTAHQPNKSKNIEAIYPLSPMQEGMLFHTLYEPESGVYFEQLSFTLHGNLDVSVFEQAWAKVVERHPVLRTLFVWENRTQPLQVVLKQVNLPWTYLDWCSLSPLEQEQQLEVFLESDRNKGFTLDKAPLIRCTLIKLAEGTYKFIDSSHHILTDGWCLPIIYKDVFAFYEALKIGKDLYLPPTRPYSDYIAWLQQQDKNQAIAYWQKDLSGFLAPTPLLKDQILPSNSQQKKTYQEVPLHLSARTTATLKALAQKHHLTVSNFVTGAWALLLSRYSGEKDIMFGATVSGRPPTLSGVESMVGLFINTLPVRVQLDSESELLPWLLQLQEQQVDREQYSYISLSQMQRLSEVPPGTSLFESIVVFENYPLGDRSIYSPPAPPDGLQITQMQGIARTNYPLILQVMVGEELSARIICDCFDADMIVRMGGHLLTLLEKMVVNPRVRLCELPLLTEAQRQQLLVEWNDTTREYPQDKCIHQLFEAVVEQYPDTVAVVFEEQQLTYRELNALANKLAHYLQTLGVKPEVMVGICVERSLEMVVGLLGILKAGGAYLPLDPTYPLDRLQYMIEDSAVSVLLTQEPLVQSLPLHQAHVVCLDAILETIADRNEANPVSGVTTDNLAYIIYTSGSTGKPKGVMNTHRGICNRLLWMQDAYQLTPVDRVLQKTPFSFDVSVWEFFWPLLTGASLVIAQPDGHRDSDYLVKAIAQQQITTLHFVPSMLQIFLEAPGLESCTCLQRVICSGEALPKELQERFFERLQCELHNLYGPTEAAIDVTFWQCKPDTNLKTVPIGRPIANTQIYILDRNLQPVPVGVVGELHIGGVGLARGYLNRPDLTAQKFIPNPYSKQLDARLYKTGDLASYLSDGSIEYRGRIDYQVKIRGFRIELGEIEAVLSQHPEVRETVVVVREDQPSEKLLVAYIVPNCEKLTIYQLRDFLKEKLPNYMIPAIFVLLNTLPITSNGKVNRKALPAPDRYSLLEEDFVAPRTPIEEVLAAIWTQVLDMERVGIYDNFFAIGGDSIRAIQIVYEANKYNLPIKGKNVFENQTIYSLAQYINSCQQEGNNAAIPLQLLEFTEDISDLLPSDTESAYPLAKIQEFILHHYSSDRQKMGVYHFQQSYDIYDDNLSLDAFKKALEILVKKHPVLRTIFITQNGKPVFQVVKANLIFSINEQEISNIELDEQESYIDEIVKHDRQNLFNIQNHNEPLFRFVIFRKAKNIFEFFMSIHHAIIDGWSNVEFFKELFDLYSEIKKGEEIKIAPAANVYQEFVALEKEIINSLDASNFWKLHLNNCIYKPLQPLSTSLEQVEYVVEEYKFDSNIIADSREFCRKLRISPKALFLSVYLDIISTVIKENTVCVGIVSNGRTERLSDPFRALGLFWNIVPLCQQVIEDKGVQIKNVQQSLIDIESYIRYPLLQIFSDQQKAELFFATFNFVHFHNAKNIFDHHGLKVSSKRSHDKFHFPLNYAVSIEPLTGNMIIYVEYDQMYFTCQQIRSMLQNYVEMFKHMVLR